MATTLDEIVAQAIAVGAEYKAARDAAAAQRAKLVPLVVALALENVDQGEIATLVRLSRQTVHAIEKSAGIVRRMSASWGPEAGS